MRWVKTLTGEEYGRVHAWGSNPDTLRDRALATGKDFIDCPQSYMEPLLIKYASQHGFDVRFNTGFVSAERTTDTNGGTTMIVCNLRHITTNHTYRIRTKYLFGADGGRSPVAKQFSFSFKREPSLGTACNVVFEADLTDLIGRERGAQLHMIANFGLRDKHTGAPLPETPLVRMVRPWTHWMLVVFGFGSHEVPLSQFAPDGPEMNDYLHQLIGDDGSVHIKVHRVDPWFIRETVAEQLSDSGDQVFILGDAAHRHPPAYGLGSNTCIQDAYNLAWKVAYVSKGWAGPGLLASYSAERQPVGATLVREANNAMRAHAMAWESMKTPELLSSPTSEGTALREQLHEALEEKMREGASLGLTMNQWYYSSAVYLADEAGPRPSLKSSKPGLPADPVVDILISTYPGNRLPHAWLDVSTRRKTISTHDVAGHGAFCLLISHGGDAWRTAAHAISKDTGIPIRTCAIGFGLDYIDVYREWRNRREVNESGCVLVRPDRFVAWRSMDMAPDCKTKLRCVLDHILSRS